MKKLWIITELFYPNESATAYIMTSIARYLSHAYDVTVVCANSNYEKDSRRINSGTLEADDKYDVISVEVADLDKNNLFKRVFRIFSISNNLYKCVKNKISKGDIVLSVTNPAIFLLYLSLLKKKVDFKYNLIVHDIFPENLIPAGIIGENFIYKIVKRVFDKAYSKADNLLVLGEDMKQIISAKIGKSKNVHIVENWGDLSINPIYASDENITLQYAGNLGRVQGLMGLLEIINSVKNDSVRYEFWGSGAVKSQMEEYVRDNKMTNVEILGSYTRSQQEEVIGRCDIAIVTLAKGMKGLGVPSKSYNILAAGKPILYLGELDSEIALMINKYSIGWAYEADDSTGITELLNSLDKLGRSELRAMGEKARLVCEKNYSENVIMIKLEEAISK